MKKIILKKGREFSVKKKHPWIFSGAVKQVDSGVNSGDFVKVVSYLDEPLGVGWYSANSQISVRIIEFGEVDSKEQELIYGRLKNCITTRDGLKDIICSNSYRLTNAEGDMLPGVVVDKYDDYLVCQFLCVGADKNKENIANYLKGLTKCRGIYERSDSDVRDKEGLVKVKRTIFGNVPELVEIEENEIKFLVDIKNGHKTGFYLDQRENRSFLGEFSHNKSILNCFSYTGGFGIYGLKRGCKEVINVDTSSDALSVLLKNVEINGLNNLKCEALRDNVFSVLKKFSEQERFFDIVILDPPKFVKNMVNLNEGIKGYKKLNARGLKIVNPGGYLFTFSCSAHVDMDIFKKIVSEALILAKREGTIIKELSQGIDHPYPPSFPQGRYLKGLIVKVFL